MMEKLHITNSKDLKTAIARLELKKEADELALKDQYHETVKSLKPVNLLKSTVKDFAQDNQWRNKIVGTAVGLGVGFLAK